MKKKVALALAGIVLMMTVSFAPVSVAQWPPAVQWDGYWTMGGQKVITLALEYGPSTFILEGPFKTRDPWLKPYQWWENITFSPETDVDGSGSLPPCVVFINVTVATPLVHYIYSPEVGGAVWDTPWLRITEKMAAPGFGWIYTQHFIADVDVLFENNDTGTFWTGSSPLAGQFAYNHTTVPFPSPGPDGLPGFCPAGSGTQDDGFGDGTPDLKGSSVLYIPEMFTVEGWNASTGTWDLLMEAPLMMVMTTQMAYDRVTQPDSPLYDMISTKRGIPWEFLVSLPWENPKCNFEVTYAVAGSLCDFVLDPGPPRIALDILYDIEETKVRQDVVIADIDRVSVWGMDVNILDIAICCKAFGAWDEGVGADGIPNTADDKQVADPRYDARADTSGLTDGYGTINIFDLVEIALDFGKTIDP